MATVIDGTAISKAIRDEVKAEVQAWTAAGNPAPGLATVLIGGEEASAVYVANKHKASDEVGMIGFHRPLPEDATQEQVLETVAELNANDEVSGILVQLPAPAQIDSDEVVELVDPAKDVDGLTLTNVALLEKNRPGLRPCTPSGVIELLRRYEIPIEGANAVIVGRSELVGRPLSRLLMHENATVTVCHSRTRDLEGVCRTADILVAAVGVPKMLGGGAVKQGAAVIDVGINLTEDGLVGDMDYDPAAERAGWITPVPGGVGPMTIALLLRNTLLAARNQSAKYERETTRT